MKNENSSIVFMTKKKQPLARVVLRKDLPSGQKTINLERFYCSPGGEKNQGLRTI